MFLTHRPIGGRIAAIASKSQAHRLLICAAFADGPTQISCPERSADIDATARCLQALGATIEYRDNCFGVTPRRELVSMPEMDCGESGSTLRFLLPIVAALGCGGEFILHGRLAQRPLSPLWEELEAHGIALSRPAENRLRVEGQLKGGNFTLAGNVSSQFISGLLFALPLLQEDSVLRLSSPLESAPYVRLTEAALARFGLSLSQRGDEWHIAGKRCFRSPQSLTVEGDWSNSAFWLCAGALSRPMTVTNLSPDSAQGDREILEILRSFGADIAINQDEITVSPRPLHAIDCNVRDIPDLVPPIALVAACAEGVSHITGAARLRIKESDRLESVSAAIRALGGEVTVHEDGLTIVGGTLRGGCVDSQNDHRIAMLAAIASTVCPQGVELSGHKAVEKSYPNFWNDFNKLVK